jgi:hypothetical protein
MPTWPEHRGDPGQQCGQAEAQTGTIQPGLDSPLLPLPNIDLRQVA